MSISSAASPDSLLPQNGLGFVPSPSASVTTGANRSSAGIGQQPQSTETSGIFPGTCIEEQPSSQEVSHVSRSPSAGSEEARRTTVISGRKCLKSSKTSGRLGSLLKTCLESSRWHSRLSLLTWNEKDFGLSCSCFQLTESVRHTGDAGLGLSPNHFNPDPDGLRPHREEVHEDGQGCQIESRHEQVGFVGQMVSASLWESIDPGVLGMADGVSEVVDEDDRKHRIKGLGNAIVPQLAYEILKGISDVEHGMVADIGDSRCG